MKRTFCEACQRFEFRQAHEIEPASLRPSLGEVVSIAVVFAAYFLAMAWAVAS
jgi:hypothetical protein